MDLGAYHSLDCEAFDPYDPWQLGLEVCGKPWHPRMH